METKRIEKFFELLKDTDIKELCWEKSGLKLRMKRANICELSNEPALECEESSTLDVFDQEIVKSKFVGSFADTNGRNKVEVKVGDRVHNGQLLGYIEAMNIFKEIASDFSGIVKKVKVNNKDHVEYSQELFLIDIK
ncbi:MAG: acetyl-CoA carboxylase biotin carboxyl carrier protein subunit [bacterium]|nr:acetyl-CoA carboxylase biotin carboxyl carrier protein subunit [bacterium]